MNQFIGFVYFYGRVCSFFQLHTIKKSKSPYLAYTLQSLRIHKCTQNNTDVILRKKR